MAKKYTEVGSILSGKDDPKSYYFKAKCDFSMEEGQILRLETPRRQIERLAEGGYLSEEEAESRLERIPTFVKYNAVLVTEDASSSNGNSKSKSKTSKRSQSQEDEF